ncbi:MAG: ABC transporter ATP-binding protein [Verrucomicrobia bacterium]|nr:ABC transporter ATP-binding protein [Verrucomicrobiota bacterium]MCF7707736.1 ABC transporter ATP-binding protein [Verrucomicrobiota bacterium]
MSLLEIENLRIELETGRSTIADDISLSLDEGETLCLVGESGCGKTVTALSIARLLPSPPFVYAGGRINLDGHDVLTLPKNRLRKIRGGVVSYIFQEPGSSLNPVFRIGNQIKETLKQHRRKDASNKEVIRLLKQVGIPAPESRTGDYPHQLSGGMQQRVMIAMALAARPKLLIADEPTTALDVTIQAQIMELLQALKEREGMSILLITHNLGLVGEISDRVAVMYAGQIVESASFHDILTCPAHPYTQALIRSVPRLGASEKRLATIPGNVPDREQRPSGCSFHPRCRSAQTVCSQKPPELTSIDQNSQVRCHFWEHAKSGNNPNPRVYISQ